MSSATSSVHTARGGRPEACYGLIAVRATVAQLFSKLSDRLAFPGGVPVPAQSLCVVACAVRRELIALLHADTCPTHGAPTIYRRKAPRISRLFKELRGIRVKVELYLRTMARSIRSP
jgi:hypothetical protein